MYRDLAQWSGIRDQILRKGVSIRQVVRETGISYTTVRKMLDYRLPQPYPLRSAVLNATDPFRKPFLEQPKPYDRYRCEKPPTVIDWMRPRKLGSQLTPRWRETDSNLGPP
jgi:hypothetical protein